MRRFPLRAIIILRRATPDQIAAGHPNTLRRLTPQEAAPHLFPQTYLTFGLPPSRKA